MAISLVKGQKLSQFVLFSPNVCYFVPRTLVIPIFSTWSLIQGFVKTTLKCADFRFLCANIGTTLFVLEVCYICPDLSGFVRFLALYLDICFHMFPCGLLSIPTKYANMHIDGQKTNWQILLTRSDEAIVSKVTVRM